MIIEPQKAHGLGRKIPERVKQDPLLWVFAEHYRVTDFCSEIRAIAKSAAFDGVAIERALVFLEQDYRLHIADKEEFLYPIISRRCDPETFIDQALGRLSNAHETALTQAGDLVKLLQDCLVERTALGADKLVQDKIEAFCALQKDNIALENAVILPIARNCLTNTDLNDLKEKFRARRK